MRIVKNPVAPTLLKQCLCLCLALAPTAVQADIFKWIDQNGRTHYSDRPAPPSKDMTEELEAAPCDQECQDNVKTQQQYRQQSQRERQQSETKRRAELESAIRSSKQQQAIHDAKIRQEQLKAEKLLKSESARSPSDHSRKP